MIKIYTDKLFVITFSICVLIVLMSNSSGRANIFGQAVTGAPGDSNKTCASSGCHASGAFAPNGVLNIMDEDGNEITNYEPGETYNITLRVESTGNPSRFGFQMVALTANLTPANQWKDLGSNMREVQLGNRNYIEHKSPSSSNNFIARWTAPDEGAGDINFYYAVNAVNNNGSPSGDGGSNSTFKLSELATSTGKLLEENIQIFPNPAAEFITIEGLENAFNYTIFDTSGKVIKNDSGYGKSRINTSDLATGIYFINLQNAGNSISRKLIKR